MSNDEPKVVGTVVLQENNNISTSKPWESVTKENLPYSVLSQPNGFMFTHGSACGSMPITSIEGYTYVSDMHVFRQDGNEIDVDRYIGSITPTNTLAVLKIPNQKIPYHHLKPIDHIINNLPPDKQKLVLGFLGTQHNP